ncbi:MAG: B12-binding domain-containing radical SAM protein [Proteobacteria bacterium]|nr:B12-binding domain-containing radical SAM protein [Pseudomonadota bacterium]
MRIKLITPAFHSRYFWDFRKLGKMLGRKSNNLLLALPTVASLTPEGHEVILVDDNITDIDYDDPVDLVGVTAMTCYVNRAFEIADEYRKRGIPVVMGGPHATLAPYEALEHVDSVVIGEAENIWAGLLEDFAKGEMKEVYRGVDAKPDMKDNPPPAWNLTGSKDYIFHGVEATRGCPFDCHFCSIKQIYGKDFRVRTTDEVIEEIKAAPGNQIFFTDDNLIGNKPFAKELFTKMKGMNIAWGCQMSINVAFMPKMLQLMKEAGCFFVFIGLETLDKDAVVAMNKPVNKMNYYDAVAKIQELGMFVIGSFIIGTDKEDRDTVKEIAEYVKVSKQSWLMVNIMNSPPGTKFLKMMEEEGRNVVYSYDDLDGAHATVTHPTMTHAETEEDFRWLYREVYDWDNMRERFVANLSQGHWKQNEHALTVFEQIKVFHRLLFDFLFIGPWAKKRFFFAIMAFMLSPRVNRATVMNVLLMGMSWNEFAHSLQPTVRAADAQPIVFRKEYMVPVSEQTLGRAGDEDSGVERMIPRMEGRKRLTVLPNTPEQGGERAAV